MHTYIHTYTHTHTHTHTHVHMQTTKYNKIQLHIYTHTCIHSVTRNAAYRVHNAQAVCPRAPTSRKRSHVSRGLANVHGLLRCQRYLLYVYVCIYVCTRCVTYMLCSTIGDGMNIDYNAFISLCRFPTTFNYCIRMYCMYVCLCGCVFSTQLCQDLSISMNVCMSMSCMNVCIPCVLG